MSNDSLTTEAILLWELWQELLHPLSTHQTWAQSQWGKATQVSHHVLICKKNNFGIKQFLMQPLTALNCNCRCLADGCSEAFVTNASMKNHMARVHHHQEKRYPVQSFSDCFAMSMLTFSGLLLLHSLVIFQCNHQGCGKDFHKKNQLKAHKHYHQELLSFQ